MKYKVGDKVLLKNKRGDTWSVFGGMDKYIGEVVTISKLIKNGFEIVEDDKTNSVPWKFRFEDIEKVVGSFSPSDLQFADILTLRNGQRYVYVTGYMYGEEVDYALDERRLTLYYDDDLTQNENDKDEDIVKVERNGRIVYERQENEVKEMTIAEISKALGYEVKVVKE